jgi:karilysin protease
VQVDFLYGRERGIVVVRGDTTDLVEQSRIQNTSLSPNPATDVVTLKLTEGGDGILPPQGQGSLTTKGVTSTYEIQLWNGLTMLRSFKTNQLTFQIPIAGLPAGLYFVRVIKDGQTYTEKLIKN